MQAIYSLIDRIERHYKTDVSGLIKGSFWLYLMRAAQIVLALVSAVAFANWLPKEVYGSYRYVLSVYAILSIVTLPGINAAVTQAAAQGVDGALIAGLRKQMTFATLGSLATLGIAGYYFLLGNPLIGFAFVIVAASIPFFDTLDLFTNYLEGKLRFKEEMWLRTLMQAISVAFLVLAAYLTNSLLWILAAYFIPYIVTRLLMHWWIVRKDRIKEGEGGRAAITFGYHLSAMEVLNQLGSNADRLIIWHVLGPAALAVYSIAAAPVIELRSVLLTVTTVILPKFVKQGIEQVRASIYSRLLYYWILVLAATTAYVLAAPYIFHLLFPLYSDSIVYTQLFAVVMIFLPKNILALTFLTHVKIKENYIENVLSNGSRILFCFILIPMWGLLGAIAAFLISQVVDGIVTWYLFEQMRSTPTKV